MCISKLVRSQHPGASPNSLHHGLQVYLETRSIKDCQFAPSWPPSASTYSLDHDRRLHLQVHSITAINCFSKPDPLRPQSASPNSHDHDLGVHLYVHSITASKCISKLGQLWPPRYIYKLARSWPPSVSLNTPDYNLQVQSIMALKCNLQ